MHVSLRKLFDLCPIIVVDGITADDAGIQQDEEGDLKLTAETDGAFHEWTFAPMTVALDRSGCVRIYDRHGKLHTLEFKVIVDVTVDNVRAFLEGQTT